MKPPIGQSTAVNLLSSAIAHKTHYNFLIHGPTGVGKTALAQWAASLFLNTNQLSGHPDLLEIVPTIKKGKELVPSPDGLIRIEQLRSEVLDLQPVQAPYRVVIIHDAHKAGQNFNALLKQMEERVVFILVTDQPQSLLETVRSRCLNIACHKLNEVDMVQVLRSTSPQTLEMEWLLQMVPGQPGRAVIIHQHLSTIGATLLGRIEAALKCAQPHDLMQVAGLIGALDKAVQLSLLAVLEYLFWRSTRDPEVLTICHQSNAQISAIKQTGLAWYLLLLGLSNIGAVAIPLVELPPAEDPPEEAEVIAPKPKRPNKSSAALAIKSPSQGKEEPKSTAAQRRRGTGKVAKNAQVDLLSLI